MKFALCFLAVVCGALALPAEVPVQTPDELDLSKLVQKNIYVEPIVSTENHDLPGSRIVGGNVVAHNSVPYQVVVIINGDSLCGGSLISVNRVLTAASCTIHASFAQVRLGAHYFNSFEETQVRITSTSMKAHAYFFESLYLNDISVIFLPTDVILNDNIKVVPLAPATAENFEEATGLLTGWGVLGDSNNDPSPVLRGTYLEVLDNAACFNFFGDLISPDKLCTSGSGIVGGCLGDSGGPLVIDGVQVGLMSFTAAGCEREFPTVFTRISFHRGWIQEYAGV